VAIAPDADRSGDELEVNEKRGELEAVGEYGRDWDRREDAEDAADADGGELAAVLCELCAEGIKDSVEAGDPVE